MSTDRITASPVGMPNRRSEIVERVADALRDSPGSTSFRGILVSARVSPDDVARELGSNEALLCAVAETVAKRLMAPLSEPPTEATFVRQLVEFSRRATHEYSGLRVKRLYRIMVADTTHEPGIKVAAYKHGPELVRSELARFFASAQSAGIQLEANSLLLATYFMSFLRSYWDLSDMSGIADPAPCDREVGKLVETFFTGIQAEARHAAY